MNLKEQLLESYNQYCDEQVEDYVLEQFGLYLQAEGMELTEDILQEGKITDAIRWKLAKFSLRFLKEDSIDAFLMAYYSDDEGQPTEEGRKWTRESKKTKVNKLRDLADKLKEDDRKKVIDNEAAKAIEKMGVVTSVGSIAFGTAGAIASDALANKVNSDYSKVEKDLTDPMDVKTDVYYNKHNYEARLGTDSASTVTSTLTGKGLKDSGFKHDTIIDYKDRSTFTRYAGVGTKVSLKPGAKMALIGVLNLVPVLVNVLFGMMWGSIIIGSVGAAKGLRKIHKANVMRSEDILSQLKNKSKKDLKEEFIRSIL